MSTTAKPRHRLSTTAALASGTSIMLDDNPAHYLTTVLRLKEGDTIAIFNCTDGEWLARIETIRKRDISLTLEKQMRPAATAVGLTVCFAPIKGGRLETIIEKATELGASVLQPVITSRTIVDKVNLERAESIAREAAEQCERVDWPEIREPIKFAQFLGSWPKDIPLIYGDESGESASITQLVIPGLPRDPCGRNLSAEGSADPGIAAQTGMTKHWGIFVGPEGGFTPEEFAALKHLKSAKGVGLGPRILRADTAVITLCALTLAAWGDWAHAPRFIGGDE